MDQATGRDRAATLEIGDSAERTFAVGEAEVLAFAELSGDRNPIHLDPAFASATPFKERIAHGMLSAAFISAVLGQDLPGPGSVYLSQSLNFKRPVRIGDEVTVRVWVTSLDPASRRVTLSTTCRARGKTVVEGQAVVLAPATRSLGPAGAA